MSEIRGAGRTGLDPLARVRCHLLLSGRVQGVGFRYYAARQAATLGVGGFARNLPDGRVEAEAEGARQAVEAFIEQLKRGPNAAAVRDVRLSWVEPTGEDRFHVG